MFNGFLLDHILLCKITCTPFTELTSCCSPFCSPPYPLTLPLSLPSTSLPPTLPLSPPPSLPSLPLPSPSPPSLPLSFLSPSLPLSPPSLPPLPPPHSSTKPPKLQTTKTTRERRGSAPQKASITSRVSTPRQNCTKTRRARAKRRNSSLESSSARVLLRPP